MKIKKHVNVQYGGHVVKKNHIILLTLHYAYGSLHEVITLLPALCLQIRVGIKLAEGQKIEQFGTFTLHEIKVKRDGSGQMVLASDNELIDNSLLESIIKQSEQDLELYFIFDITE